MPQFLSNLYDKHSNTRLLLYYTVYMCDVCPFRSVYVYVYAFTLLSLVSKRPSTHIMIALFWMAYTKIFKFLITDNGEYVQV